MLTLNYIKKLAKHYAKMFDTSPEIAEGITNNRNINGAISSSLIFVAPPNQKHHCYMLGTIGMSQFRQSGTKTPYTELVLTLPATWRLGHNQKDLYWPTEVLTNLIYSPKEKNASYQLYSSFALNENFDTFDQYTDKCAAIFTPLALFDHKKFGKLRMGLKNIHFMQLFPINKYTFDVLDKDNRKELVDKIINSNQYDRMCN